MYIHIYTYIHICQCSIIHTGRFFLGLSRIPDKPPGARLQPRHPAGRGVAEGRPGGRNKYAHPSGKIHGSVVCIKMCCCITCFHKPAHGESTVNTSELMRFLCIQVSTLFCNIFITKFYICEQLRIVRNSSRSILIDFQKTQVFSNVCLILGILEKKFRI